MREELVKTQHKTQTILNQVIEKLAKNSFEMIKKSIKPDNEYDGGDIIKAVKAALQRQVNLIMNEFTEPDEEENEEENEYEEDD